MTYGSDERREPTRALLARTIVRLLALLATALLIVIMMQRSLGISNDAVRAAMQVVLAVAALAAVVVRFYFARR